jgi:hypothetical protein
VGLVAVWLIFDFSSEPTCRTDYPPYSIEAQDLQSAAAQPRPKFEPPDLDLRNSRVAAFTELPPEPTPAPATPAKAAFARETINPPDPLSLPEGSFGEMQAKRKALHLYLSEKAKPIMEQRYKAGLFDHLINEEQWKSTGAEWERTSIYKFQYDNVRGWDRIMLPREEFPDLYVYKDDIVRLDKLMDDTRSSDARATAGAK